MGVCKHWRMNNGVEVVILEDEEIGVILAGETICDACRRKLCTCERCSAAFEDRGKFYCHATPSLVLAEDGIVLPAWWCRDGWRQARPWTAEEVMGWLAEDPDAVDPEEQRKIDEGEGDYDPTWGDEGP